MAQLVDTTTYLLTQHTSWLEEGFMSMDLVELEIARSVILGCHISTSLDRDDNMVNNESSVDDTLTAWPWLWVWFHLGHNIVPISNSNIPTSVYPLMQLDKYGANQAAASLPGQMSRIQCTTQSATFSTPNYDEILRSASSATITMNIVQLVGMNYCLYLRICQQIWKRTHLFPGCESGREVLPDEKRVHQI